MAVATNSPQWTAAAPFQISSCETCFRPPNGTELAERNGTERSRARRRERNELRPNTIFVDDPFKKEKLFVDERGGPVRVPRVR